MAVCRHACGGAAPAGAAEGVQKTPSPRRAPRFCPGRPPAEDEGVQTPPGQRPRAAEFCFRGTTSLAALLQAATLPRPRPPFQRPAALCARGIGRRMCPVQSSCLLHRSDVGSTLAPLPPFVNRFLSISSYFLQQSCANRKILCSLNFPCARNRSKAFWPTP